MEKSLSIQTRTFFLCLMETWTGCCMGKTDRKPAWRCQATKLSAFLWLAVANEKPFRSSWGGCDAISLHSIKSCPHNSLEPGCIVLTIERDLDNRPPLKCFPGFHGGEMKELCISGTGKRTLLPACAESLKTWPNKYIVSRLKFLIKSL